MFPTDRQEKLDPILNSLSGSPGVVSVEQDDFCSTSIQVFLNLDTEERCSPSCRPKTFTVSLRSAKAGVSQILREAGIDFNFLHWPILRYFNCNGERYSDGYSDSFIKVEVYV